jgi:A/G-specific adenine glycosylase
MALQEAAFVDGVIAWYRASARVLPWRQRRDPYAILVSEIMLQQTQVGRVVGRYNEWMARWPTAAALADATAGEVISAWSGLGYNNRAVRLHATARQVARDGWPSTYDGLLALPGVGPYTAAAVACLAFGEDRLPVDVNIRRVLRRALDRDMIEAPAGRTADLTQALFDLGATVCIARRPRCGVCPLAAGCPSRGRTYEPERKQGRFEGSRRQARGALLRRVAAGAVALADADADIAAALARDGLVSIASGRITLPGE